MVAKKWTEEIPKSGCDTLLIDPGVSCGMGFYDDDDDTINRYTMNNDTVVDEHYNRPEIRKNLIWLYWDVGQVVPNEEPKADLAFNMKLMSTRDRTYFV